METFRLNISPKYKKSFVEYTIIQKLINDKLVKVKRELLWRSGEIEVSITEDDLEKYCKDKELKFSKLQGNENLLFESLKKNDILTFDDSFPFEHEFLSSFDGCSTDYYIYHDDGSDVEESVEDEINNVLEEGDFYDLEDDHGYDIVDTIYEIHGDLDIII
jgi:hypothetical protein